MEKIAYSKSSLKVVRRLRASEARQIAHKIKQYASDPQSMANNAKALTGSPYIRLRVVDWRVIIDDKGSVLDILKISSRGSVYE
ncbi:cytotoxic translational repressor of toxin-antitoxin stability system [Allorhizobium ampelinum]|nr:MULTISPECIES: cytotoxic translational repressor of toxin-antitoxin stability system [Rhizobium/Agrobacterium group]MCF1481651.1 type II toxin-antitoxin system RelE/ParE family toxin [Allorhizobium ampelinum]NSZ42578.1 type II toxin-antitoxin system RelE/ParE family toxin [Agrobacterium vitis]NTA26286.1 type II toxin-antitoxin system RelE/ParE family toxin [Allorhizobium ampelinum]OVE95589.1 cytotoxic translational repressor of toxin-antitoxin stability system [Allorhizobium ampelinum]